MWLSDAQVGSHSWNYKQFADQRIKSKSDTDGVIKTSATAEKTDKEEKEDKAAQSLLSKLIKNNIVDNTNQVELLYHDPNFPL